MNDALHGREAWRPQGSAIVVVGERWGIHGPGEATLDSVDLGSNPGSPARDTGFFGSVSARAEKCDTCGG